MSRKSKQHDKQFKLDAVKYVNEHPDLTQEECCKNLGISLSTLARWRSQYLDNNGDIPTRGSGNYASDEQKEIARLGKELENIRKEINRSKGMLGNQGFVSKAPAQLVQQEKDKLEAAEAKAKALENRIAELNENA